MVQKSGIVIRQDSAVVRGKAKKLGLAVKVSDGWLLPWSKTLFLINSEAAPWDLLSFGFEFLDKWDAAVPSWELAEGLGTAEERQRTEKIALDLRQPTYEPRLLFVRDNPAGRELLGAWRAECGEGDDEHLAFLRAVHLVKPKLCVLPSTWLAKMERRTQQFLTRLARRRRPTTPSSRPLVTVELEPGRFVKCHKGDEERVLAQFKRQRKAR